MSEFVFDVAGGESITLLTEGKYCPSNIIVNALGGNSSGPDITIPDGYTIEMGMYIPESDISSNISIDLEHTFRWADTGKTSACYLAVFGVDLRSGTSAAGAGLHVKFGVGERNHQMVQTTSGTTTSSTVFINPSTTTTFNQIKITGTGTYPLKKGISYMWMVIGETI